jgi:hypothetical protein
MSANLKAEYVKDVETLIHNLNDPSRKGQFVVYKLNQRESVFLVKGKEIFHYDRDGRSMAADLRGITSKLGLNVHDVSGAEMIAKAHESVNTSIDYGSAESSTIENAIQRLQRAAAIIEAATTTKQQQNRGVGFFKREVPSSTPSENHSSTPRPKN